MAKRNERPRSGANRGASSGSSRGANGPRPGGSSSSGSRGAPGRSGPASRTVGRPGPGPAGTPSGASAEGASRPGGRPIAKAVAAKPKEIALPPQIVVRDLADNMHVSPIELIKALMNAGIMANINQVLDHDTASIIAEEMGYAILEPVKPATPEVSEVEAPAEPVRRRRREYSEVELAHLKPRPPVVVVMGHVDHGKTSILDAIRKASVVVGEAGGITQHIGAYQTQVNDKLITFLDTPGHEAFTAMRARGASVTDIAILVVAADDGVQPQTREAIAHARSAGVPIIVALNKIDLATANPDRVKQQLADEGLVVEDWGGEVICVPVSARTKQGIDDLLDMVLLVAEMENLRADPDAPVAGSVVEGRLDRAMGPMATVLVQEGTLHEGDTMLVGQTFGRLRALFDYKGTKVHSAGPSMPVAVTGLGDVPVAGDRFRVVGSEREARQIVDTERVNEARAVSEQPVQALTLDQIYARAQSGAVQSLNLILKADVDGSIEPIRVSLEKLEAGDLKAKFVHVGVGNVTDSDVNLAVASQAVIIGFHVGVDGTASRLAESEGVGIRTYDVIYRLIEDVQKALTGMLEPEYADVLQGTAIVREVFTIPRVGKIAGVQVREGKALRNATVKVKRNGQVTHEGRVTSLKRFTEDAREVAAGLECGVGVEGLSDVQADDTLEFYTRELVQ